MGTTLRRREIVLTLLAGLVPILHCLVLLLADHRYFWHDDWQLNYLPGFTEIARIWSEGELPLISDRSWMAGALAGEYQYGVFSIFVTANVLLASALGLSFPLTAAFLATVHFGVLSAGTFRLARRLGLDAAPSFLAASVASINGWLFLWGGMNWFPALASFAWIPWFWWGLERAQDVERGPSRFVLPAIFLYSILTAGWPYTVLMAGILTIWILLRSGWSWAPIAAWAGGLGLSAPAWMMLLEYTPHTARGQTPLALIHEWVVPLASLPGLLFPPHTVVWPTYASLRPHVSSELTGGTIPLVILVTALVAGRREALRTMRWELLLALVALALAASPGLGNFRWSFRWLPLFFLALGLAAARAVSVPGGLNRGLVSALLVLLAWMPSAWTGIAPAVLVSSQLVFLLGLSSLWVLADTRSRFRGAMPCALHVAACWTILNEGPRFLEVPTWRLEERPLARPPHDPEIRYLAVLTADDIHDGRQTTGAALLPGSTSMCWGIEYINGYSPMAPAGIRRTFDMGLHGFLGEAAAERILSQEIGPDGLLSRMAVDGLVVADRFAAHTERLLAAGWKEAATVEGGRLYHRVSGPSPRVRLVEGAEARVTVRHTSRERVEASVEGGAAGGLVLFSRPWYPGYRASLDGQDLTVELADGMMPAVRLPAGARGTLALDYRPAGFRRGVLATIATLLAIVFVWIAGFRRARAPAATNP